MIQITLDCAQEILALQTPKELVQQLAAGSLLLQKIRGGAKAGDKKAALDELGELRALLEPLEVR